MQTLVPPGAAVPTTSAKRKKPRVKFLGPIHVLVLDTSEHYCRTTWCALAMGLVNLLVGAVNMTVLLYSVVRGDAHVFVCTFAYHFFSAEAILCLNYANSWSTPLHGYHRKFVHILLQICGMVTAVAGTMHVCVSRGVSGSAHGVTGLLTSILAIFSLLSGPSALLPHRTLHIIHMSLGIPTFSMASISLILGLLTDGFRSWATPTIAVVVIIFIVIYTGFIVITVVMKCTSHL